MVKELSCVSACRMTCKSVCGMHRRSWVAPPEVGYGGLPPGEKLILTLNGAFWWLFHASPVTFCHPVAIDSIICHHLILVANSDFSVANFCHHATIGRPCHCLCSQDYPQMKHSGCYTESVRFAFGENPRLLYWAAGYFRFNVLLIDTYAFFEHLSWKEVCYDQMDYNHGPPIFPEVTA